MFLNIGFSLTNEIIRIFYMILEIIYSYFLENIGYEYFVKHVVLSTIGEKEVKKMEINRKVKVGLLTNEIPPIVYGGVATWIVNFIKMFEGHKNIIVVPIYLAYNDALPKECYDKYANIRVIECESDIKEAFSGIDVCINNLWISLETII